MYKLQYRVTWPHEAKGMCFKNFLMWWTGHYSPRDIFVFMTDTNNNYIHLALVK